MTTKDFYYDLPPELIAQTPPAHRQDARLLHLDKESGRLDHGLFPDLAQWLRPGDLLVFNRSKVSPARLYGLKVGGTSQVEVLLLKRLEGEADQWEVLVKPGRRCKIGTQLLFSPRLRGEVVATTEAGRIMAFSYEGAFPDRIREVGHMPTPPYIHKQLVDPSRYQTVYAQEEGSAAAPTAGLHFTQAFLDQLGQMGVQQTSLILHVGLGTFKPVEADDVADHHMHTETYTIPEETARLVNQAKAEGRRVVAVGTTSTRALEASAQDGRVQAGSRSTNIFITPGYAWQIVDALVTNFHLPKSTLLMLVSALAGRDHVLAAYAEAVARGYRFFSFGDAMFID